MINIALILLVFGATKKKISPYVSALVLCAIKTALYYVGTRNLFVAVLNGVIYAALAFGLVYFLRRVDQKEPPGPSYGTPGTKRSGSTFAWEYIPLSCILVLMIFGEAIASLFRVQAA